MDSPAIAIIGSGAVGGYYGARLAQHGHAVHFLLRSDFQAVHQRGWTIESCNGDFHLHPNQFFAYAKSTDMPPVDLVIITLKTTANGDLHHLISPLLKEETAILTLQNGLGNEEALADLFGSKRILGGLAFTCINRIGPGHIRHSAHGLIRLGEYKGGPCARAEAVAKLFNSSGIPCQVLADLQFGKWEKLVWNVPFNGLGAALDLSTDRLIANAAGENLVRQLMEEVVATAKAAGVNLPSGIIQQKIEQTREMGVYFTSMQLDRRSGRKMEISSIVAQPLAIAEKSAVKTPLLRLLKEQLTAVQASG